MILVVSSSTAFSRPYAGPFSTVRVGGVELSFSSSGEGDNRRLLPDDDDASRGTVLLLVRGEKNRNRLLLSLLLL